MRLRPTMLPYLCHLNPDKTISQKIMRFDVKRGSGDADDAAKPTDTESTFTCPCGCRHCKRTLITCVTHLGDITVLDY